MDEYITELKKLLDQSETSYSDQSVGIAGAAYIDGYLQGICRALRLAEEMKKGGK